jgi:hypothetical protein
MTPPLDTRDDKARLWTLAQATGRVLTEMIDIGHRHGHPEIVDRVLILKRDLLPVLRKAAR